MNVFSTSVVSLSRLTLSPPVARVGVASMGWKVKGGGVPDRWEDYSNIGKVVEGTTFIPFKVPLNEVLLKQVGDGVESWGLKLLLETVPQLGLVVDLTNTSRYYKAKQLEGMGVKYCKIFTKGHEVPDKGVVDKFYKALEGMEGKMVGVHCTHGLNRTGYLICRYMVEKMGLDPGEAIQAFDVARGHKQERENYLEHIRNRAWESETGNKVVAVRSNCVKDGGRRDYHTDSGWLIKHNSDPYQDYYSYDDYYSEYFPDYHPGYCYPFPLQQYSPPHGECTQWYGGGGGGHHGFQEYSWNTNWVQGSPYRGSLAAGPLQQVVFSENQVNKDLLDTETSESQRNSESSEKENTNSGEINVYNLENREVKPNLILRLPTSDISLVYTTVAATNSNKKTRKNKNQRKTKKRKQLNN